MSFKLVRFFTFYICCFFFCQGAWGNVYGSAISALVGVTVNN